MRVLVTPPAAQRDENSTQMLSAWIAENGLHCTLNVGMWSGAGINEPAAWGKLLADVARHIGNAMHEQTGANATSVVDSVVRAFVEELGEPTTDVKGGFHAGAN
jgi:hypothetical protein